MRHTIGCDVGSQGLKAVLWSEDGRILCEVGEPYPIVYPRPAWSEQDSSLWWRAMSEAIPRLLEKSGVSPDDIVAIGVDGTVHGSVPVGKEGHALAPAFGWTEYDSIS